jgi:hypothetical protein
MQSDELPIVNMKATLQFSAGWLSYEDAAPLLSALNEKIAFVNAERINPRGVLGGPGLVLVALEFVLRATAEAAAGVIALRLASSLAGPSWRAVRDQLRRVFNQTGRGDELRYTDIIVGRAVFQFASYADLSKAEFDERLLRLGDHIRALPEEALRPTPRDESAEFLRWDDTSRSWQPSDPPWANRGSAPAIPPRPPT